MDQSRAILYIEDHYHSRRLVQKVLGAAGYTVLTAEDAATGWKLIKQHRPPLVLVDIALPGELDGLEVVRRVRSDPALSSIHIIALTASAMLGDKERFLAAGCDDYLPKPLNIQHLLQRVTAFFEQEEHRHGNDPDL